MVSNIASPMAELASRMTAYNVSAREAAAMEATKRPDPEKAATLEGIKKLEYMRSHLKPTEDTVTLSPEALAKMDADERWEHDMHADERWAEAGKKTYDAIGDSRQRWLADNPHVNEFVINMRNAFNNMVVRMESLQHHHERMESLNARGLEGRANESEKWMEFDRQWIARVLDGASNRAEQIGTTDDMKSFFREYTQQFYGKALDFDHMVDIFVHRTADESEVV